MKQFSIRRDRQNTIGSGTNDNEERKKTGASDFSDAKPEMRTTSAIAYEYCSMHWPYGWVPDCLAAFTVVVYIWKYSLAIVVVLNATCCQDKKIIHEYDWEWNATSNGLTRTATPPSHKVWGCCLMQGYLIGDGGRSSPTYIQTKENPGISIVQLMDE